VQARRHPFLSGDGGREKERGGSGREKERGERQRDKEGEGHTREKKQSDEPKGRLGSVSEMRSSSLEILNLSRYKREMDRQ
jgi:hypothetical protein